ncbi:MAG: protoporphyrinogen oxidase [Verrucomicrobia bacterium]|nr:protoporphyrinogen oxidase [Verrucomicrobiota bacterium]
MKSIAIIGGGITGLTAAFRLGQKNIPTTLYEAGPRAGGVISTVRREGYLAESGPNSILETSPLITALVRDLGLEPRRLNPAPAAKKRYVVRGGQPIALPQSPLGFFTTPLFSVGAKLGLLAEPFVPRAPEAREESIAEFVTRRIGNEFLDYAINPFVAGVYAGNPAQLSVRHAFPKLYALEQKYGSLILGQFLGARERRRRAEVSKQAAKMFSFDDGLQVLTDTLAGRLADRIRFSTPVVRFQQTSEGWRVTVRQEGCEETHDHAAVIFTAPVHRLPEMQLQSERYLNWAPLSQINYPPVASVALGFRRDDVAHPLDGFGVLIPEKEQFNILGTLFSSSLFPNRAPAGHVTLTSFAGGTRHPELAMRGAEKLVRITLQDLRALLGVAGQPTFQHIALFPKAIPQYEVGYGQFEELMREVEEKAPGFFLAGNYRRGISLGDSIVSGHHVAESAERHWTTALPKEAIQVPKFSTELAA